MRPKDWNKEEKWKPIRGYEDRYSVSDMGRIRREGIVFPKGGIRTRPYTLKERIVKATVSNDVAKVVLLNDDRTRKWFQVKDLVGNHWLKPRVQGAKVYLIDDTDPRECWVGNLRQDGVKPAHYKSVFTKEDILKIKDEIKELGRVRGVCAMLARKYEVSRYVIRDIASGRNYKSKPEEKK